jgi:hypothetical protein
MLEQTAAEARSLAMRTRRATVMEFDASNDTVWVNQLAGARCDNNIERTCVVDLGKTPTDITQNQMAIVDGIYADADIAVCNVRAATVDAAGDCAGASLADSFAICFDGEGFTYLRDGADANAVCTATSAPITPSVTGADAWPRTCAAWTATAGDAGVDDAETYSGVVFSLNRFESGDGDCAPGVVSTGALDVVREVHIPAGGHPFSKIAFEVVP